MVLFRSPLLSESAVRIFRIRLGTAPVSPFARGPSVVAVAVLFFNDFQLKFLSIKLYYVNLSSLVRVGYDALCAIQSAGLQPARPAATFSGEFTTSRTSFRDLMFPTNAIKFSVDG